MPSKRSKPNFAEQSLGITGTVKKQKTAAQALDYFMNQAARTGLGSPNLGASAQYELVRLSFDYWTLLVMYRNHWISRRIVDTPAQDMVRAWPKLTSDVEPKDLSKLDRAIRRTMTRTQLLTALQWGRLFGGAGCLMVIDGQEDQLDEPLDLDSIPLGGYKGLIPFDRWAGISPSVESCNDFNRPLDFGKPEYYECRAPQGGHTFKVHASRILRCLGPEVPTPEKEAQSLWGISVLEPVFEEIQKRDNMSWNILNLTFRANILGMKFPDLASLMSGLGMPGQAAAKFEQRMSAINQLISNQSLIPLPQDGGIESTQYSFAGVSEVYQQFQLDISGAAQIPVTRLWGRTISGLGQANDADERIYEERIATDQEIQLRPQMEKLYPVLCMSELGEVPDDLDLTFPSVRVLDEKEKSELAKATVDTVTVALNSGGISLRTYAQELKQSSDITGVFTNITDEMIAKLPDEVASEGEFGMGGALGEAEGSEEGEGTQLTPSSGPQKVLREEKGKAADAYVSAERCGKPQWRTCPECGGRIHRHDCNVKLNAERDCTKERGCKYSLLHAGQSTSSYKGPATDADGPAAKVFDHHGLRCVVETPKGHVRSGKDFAVRMPAHYGFIEGTKGADGDSLDMYYGDGPSNGWTYVVDQNSLDGKHFDEHKIMLNFPSQRAAIDTYTAGHHKGASVIRDWTPMPIAAFKEWLTKHDMGKPCAP